MLYAFRDFRPNLPVMISETGSDSNNGNDVAAKAAWISALIPYFAEWSISFFSIPSFFFLSFPAPLFFFWFFLNVQFFKKK
jgi:hypothetical protein